MTDQDADDAELTAEEISKDRYFKETTALAKEMIAAHGRDFSIGALVLAAKWISEGKIDADTDS